MITTPPSSMSSVQFASYNELDFDFEAALASASPALKSVEFIPAPCVRSHSSSLSTISDDYSLSDNDMSFQGDEDLPHQYYYTPSTEASYYASSVTSPADLSQYSYAPDYSQFQPTSWESSTMYPQHQGLPMFSEQQAPSSYPPFEETPLLSNANIIPPTPQSPAQATFNFNTMPQTSQDYLVATPGMSRPRSISGSHEGSIRSLSRSTSPASNLSSSPSTASLQAYGTLVSQSQSSPTPQTWRCGFPGCTSRALFTRGCDLRKHYNRHSKHLFCRVEGCPQSTPRDTGDGCRGSVSGSVGFSSKKDRARHEAKHNPGIPCEWRGPDGEGCGRLFSRVDNMKDHVRRIHQKGSQQ